MTYSAYVVKIEKLRKHTNADRLMIATVFGNDVIVGKDVKVGDVMVYFPTDGRLGLEFAEKNNLLRKKDKDGKNTGGYLDPKKRHIRAIKLRGEESDGLLTSLDSLSHFCDINELKVGDKINVLNGVLICEKYIPERNNRTKTHSNNKKKQNKANEFPHFQEHVSTPQLAYNKNKFREGDWCTITLKLHGTSGRTGYVQRDKGGNFIKRFLSKIGVKFKNDYEYVSGTRRVVLDKFDGGYYGNNEFREKWHNFFKGKLKKGETVYYEIVGYVDEDTTIMPKCNNKKMKDEDFLEKYGDTTTFTYGCERGENDIYVYRMTMTGEDGHVIEYPTWLTQYRCEQMGVKHVPVLDTFKFTSIEDLDSRIDKFGDGADPIGKTHIREGVCVRIENRWNFSIFKHKNFPFKVLEGIIKDDGILDIEEEQNL